MFGKRSDQPRTSEDRARAAADRAARRTGRPLPQDAFEREVRPPDIDPGDAPESTPPGGEHLEHAPSPDALHATEPTDDIDDDAAPVSSGENGTDLSRDADARPAASSPAAVSTSRADVEGGEDSLGDAARPTDVSRDADADEPRRTDSPREAAAGAERLVEAAPVDAAPVEAASVDSAPVEAPPADAAPVDAAPRDATPVDATSVDTAPVADASPRAESPRDAPPAAEAVNDAPAVNASPRADSEREAARGQAPHGSVAASSDGGGEPSSRSRHEHLHQPTVEYTPFQTDEHFLGDPREGEPELVAARGRTYTETSHEETAEHEPPFEPKPLRPAPPRNVSGPPRRRPAPNAPRTNRRRRTTAPPPRATKTTGSHWGRRILSIFAIVVFVAALYAVNATFQPFHGDGSENVKVKIPANTDAHEVGKLLVAKHVIDSARFFELNATVSGERSKLRPGEYTLKKGSKYSTVLAALTKVPESTATPTPTVKLTLVEGPSRKENAPVVDKSKKVKGSYQKASGSKPVLQRVRKLGAPKGTKTAEGFLFPATYELPVGSKASALVNAQLDAFKENFKHVDMSYAKSKNLSRYDVLIIASMIEREAQLARERPLISAVIYNRLKQGMPLQIDATIRYYTNNWTKPILESQLNADEPYNLSLNRGLPPTPIGNPGLASMKAAAKPSKKPYLYYVRKANDNSGEHAFSSTDAEFAKDLARYNASRGK